MDQPVNPLTLQFLAWVATRPRSYGEAIEAWRSSCPRLSIWEDAIVDGLIEFNSGGRRTRNESTVVLTPRGRVLLEQGQSRPPVQQPVSARARTSAE